MHTQQTCRGHVVVLVLMAIFASAPNAAAVGETAPSNETTRGEDAELLQFVDARDYRHCHNLPRRTYCHATERLPRNGPPNTDTPARNREPCWVNNENCLFWHERG